MNREMVEQSSAFSGNSASSARINHRWFISYLLSNTAYGLTIPLIPLFVVLYLRQGVFWDGIVYSVSSAASVPALLLWGNLSDRVNKRKVFILVGFLGSGAAYIPILMANSMGLYLLFLIVAQVLGMASVPVSNLLIFENTKQSLWSRVMATFSMVTSTGTVLGLAIGTAMVIIYGAGVSRAIPLFYTVAGIIYVAAMGSAFFTLREPSRRINRAKLSSFYSLRAIERVRYFPSSVIHIISDRKLKSINKLSPPLRHYIYFSALLMFGFQLFILAFPVYVIQKAGGTTLDIFYLYLLNAIFSTVTFRLAGDYIRNKGGKKALSLSLYSRFATFGVASIFPYLVMQPSESLLISIAIYSVVGAFWAFISIGQISFVSDNATARNRGRAVGYYNSFFGFGQIGGSFVSGLLSEYLGFGVDFAVSAAVVLAGTLFILKYYPHIRIRSADPEGSSAAQ